jgi:hypothetical protein
MVAEQAVYGLPEGGIARPMTPIPTTNLALWLKAGAIVGLNDGDPVDFWPPSGPTQKGATSTSTLRPLFKENILRGNPVVRFDGSNDEMTINGMGTLVPSAAHLFVVVIINSDTGYNIYNHGNVDSWWRYLGDGNGYLGCFRSSRINTYPSSMPTSGAHIFELQSSSTNYEFFLDKVSKGAQLAAYQAGTDHTLGRPDNTDGNKYFNGDIAEIILYSAIQNVNARGVINSYLTTKYAL